MNQHEAKYSFSRKNLRRGRIYKEQSLEGLAIEVSGRQGKAIKADSIRRWETGGSTPSADQIAIIASIQNLSVEFYFNEKLSPEQADLSKHSEKNVQEQLLERLSENMEVIKEKVIPAERFDPMLYKVRTKPLLREIVQMLEDLNEEKLRELSGAIRMFLFTKGQERDRPSEKVG